MIRNILRHISREFYLDWRLLCEFPEVPSSKWWHSGRSWKQAGNFCPSSLPSTTVGTPAFTHFAHTFLHWRRKWSHPALIVFVEEYVVKKERERTFFIKELMLDVALWYYRHASLVRLSQETESGIHKDCGFCWSKTFWWGDIYLYIQLNFSYSHGNCLSICPAGAGIGCFDMKEKRSWLSPFAFPS